MKNTICCKFELLIRWQGVSWVVHGKSTVGRNASTALVKVIALVLVLMLVLAFLTTVLIPCTTQELCVLLSVLRLVLSCKNVNA